ncbi:MAG: hypothetical protein EBT27_12500, partial [Betaproteobacteria bacterium]|nr:hypothetical protein [Betaproteobacteria bacterium]
MLQVNVVKQKIVNAKPLSILLTPSAKEPLLILLNNVTKILWQDSFVNLNKTTDLKPMNFLGVMLLLSLKCLKVLLGLKNLNVVGKKVEKLRKIAWH